MEPRYNGHAGKGQGSVRVSEPPLGARGARGQPGSDGLGTHRALHQTVTSAF